FTPNTGPSRTAHLTVLGQQVTITQAGSTYVPAKPVTLVSSGLHQPGGVAVDAVGNVFIADTLNHALKEWHAAPGTVSTLHPPLPRAQQPDCRRRGRRGQRLPRRQHQQHP